MVGDVVEFSLTPDGWEGAFGFVTMKLHRGAVDGNDVHYVRTDASDRDFASAERLVFVPKLAGLAAEGLSGAAQVLEDPDTTAGRVTFKLSQCYPGNRYFVLDHSMAPMAEMTFTSFSPRLHDGPTAAGATGRTNVFMNGVEGPRPMGFQPSVFDFAAGDAAWSPYWDHYAYRWRDSATPTLLTTQAELFRARDAGQLEEFPGVPDTRGTAFTVNCPVPVLAPNDFTPA
ncbi:MAG: DUF7482 domain-containing protein [Acidimicrobiales bacterium]